MVAYSGQCQHRMSTEILDVDVAVWGSPGGAVAKNPLASAGDTGSIPGS